MATYGEMPRLDFSPIGQLGQVYDQAKLKANRERTLAELGQGAPIGDVANKLFSVGDVEGGLSLARLADAQAMREYNIKRDERDFGFRQQEAQQGQQRWQAGHNLQQRQVDASLEGGKVPAGWHKTATGIEPIPQGPADPAYLEKVAGAKQKPRDFSVSDITKLSEEGGKFSNLAGFKSTFEPRFAGYGTEASGNVATFLGRNAPGIVPKNTAETAQWWQGYDRYKNVVRNELFGSALTAPEKAAFERADINPGMDPATITKNLETQERVAKNGLKRKANALIQAGYPPEQISAAYGLDLSELGVTATGKGKTAPPGAAPTPSPAAPSPAVAPPSNRVRDGFDAAFGKPEAKAATPEPVISSKAQYDSLPSGTKFKDERGRMFEKP